METREVRRDGKTVARNSTVIRKFPWKLETGPGDFGLRERERANT